MNIFILDNNPKQCAQYHVDKHCVKMILEYSQLLCGVHHVTNSQYEIPYKLSHKNHPCAIWARECMENYDWLCELGICLCEEYTHRYGKRHKSQDIIEWAMVHKPKIKSNGNKTPFALAMPDECKVGNAIESYREYYRVNKRGFATWKDRETPYWFK